MASYADWLRQFKIDQHARAGRVRQLFGRAKRRLSGTLGDEPWNGRMPFLIPALRRSQTRGRLPRKVRPRVVHIIGSLGPGGAERQLCNLALVANRMGHDVRVLLMWEPVGMAGYYGPLLQEAGVRVITAGATFHPGFPAAVNRVPGGVRRVSDIPPDGVPVAVDLLGELLVDPPDILHTWLDSANVWGGVAGILAEIPLIIMSTWNVNPTNFPVLSHPGFRIAYNTLLQSPSVCLTNNSNVGAEDYAAWLGISRERISVVLNGLDLSKLNPPSPLEVATFRERAEIPPEGQVIAGVFRLAEEKQPLVFLEVIRRVVQQCPNAVVVIAGNGPYEEQMRAFVAAHDLQPHVRFLGHVSDLRLVYGAAAVMLLCSRQEGMPNVLLESQWLGCPVVSTKAGGAVEAVDHGVTGCLLDVGDIDGLQTAVVELLRDEPRRRTMAANGPAFVNARFSLDQMVRETIRLYGITETHELSA